MTNALNACATRITHRHYYVTKVIKAFPDFRFNPLEAGIARVHREMAKGG